MTTYNTKTAAKPPPITVVTVGKPSGAGLDSIARILIDLAANDQRRVLIHVEPKDRNAVVYSGGCLSRRDEECQKQ